MELPDLGNHCSKKTCNKLDFLPIKCDACCKIFCDEHYNYAAHNCSDSYKKNNQVPVCPLCNIPIPTRGQLPDIAVGAHIDSDCQSDPAKNRRRIFTNRCSKNGCKVKEVVPIVCKDCKSNFCLKHRHPIDHDCKERVNKVERQNGQRSWTTKTMEEMSEDEALARALQLSMQQSPSSKALTQEELDYELARQLQASETGGLGNSRDNNQQRCSIS